MSIRVFIFRHHCNTQAICLIEFRRATDKDKHVGRRIIDGEVADTVKAGWKEMDNALHICPESKYRKQQQHPTCFCRYKHRLNPSR